MANEPTESGQHEEPLNDVEDEPCSEPSGPHPLVTAAIDVLEEVITNLRGIELGPAMTTQLVATPRQRLMARIDAIIFAMSEEGADGDKTMELIECLALFLAYGALEHNPAMEVAKAVAKAATLPDAGEANEAIERADRTQEELQAALENLQQQLGAQVGQGLGQFPKAR